MRQKAVSTAPQNEAPIQSPPTAAAMPIVVELSRTRSIAVCSEPWPTLGKRRWRSLITLSSMPGAVDDLAEDEQDQQREREDREHQVVGDHPGEAGDVLLVSAVPERP